MKVFEASVMQTFVALFTPFVRPSFTDSTTSIPPHVFLEMLETIQTYVVGYLLCNHSVGPPTWYHVSFFVLHDVGIDNFALKR